MVQAKGVMDTIYPWWFDEREFPRRAVLTEWFYNPLKGQPRYIDVYRFRALAASEWVWMCTSTLIEEVAQVPWEIVPKDPALEEAPPEDILDEIQTVQDFLNNPNPNKGETINTLFRALIRDSLELDALGMVKGFSANSYVQHPAGGWELKPRGERNLVELFGRDGGSFLKEVDVDGIEYRYWQYSYLHPAVAPIEFDVDEICYMMRYPRTYSAYGWAETQSMETILNLLINSAFTDATMFQEYSVPSGVVSFTGSPEDEDRLREYFRTEIKGRFHKVAVLNKDAKFVPLAYTNRDLEFLEGQKWFGKLVWAIYKLTPTELGFQDEIRETGKAMNAQGVIQKRKGVSPVLAALEQMMNNQIVNEFSPLQRIKFRFKATDRQEEMAEDELYAELGKLGFVLPDEWRKKRKWGGPTEWGGMPIDIAKALITAGAKSPAQAPTPQQTTQVEAQPTGEMERIPHQPLSAEEKAIWETLKAWGANPNMSWDFADKSDRATPIFVRTQDGRFVQVAEPSPRRLPPKEVARWRRKFYDGSDIAVGARGHAAIMPQDRVFQAIKTKFPGISDRELLVKVNEVIVKQYGDPNKSRPTPRRIGPYAGHGRAMPYPMGAMGNRPDEPIRRGELLPGENPEEIQRAREAGSVLEAGGLGEEQVESPEEQGDVTRRDPRKPPIGPPAKSGLNAKRWEMDHTHGHGNVGTMHSRVDQSIKDNIGPRRQPTDPVHDVNTESQFYPISEHRADGGSNPRRPTPTIPAGPKNPHDVPPVHDNTGAVGAGSPTGPAKKKPQRHLGLMGASNPQGPTRTPGTGPEHQETLGYLERRALRTDPRTAAMWEKERKEHPDFSDQDIDMIVQDHLREKGLLQGEGDKGQSYAFDLQGREKYAEIYKQAGYVERPEFADATAEQLKVGHWCATCPYMKQTGASPTGYFCTEIKAPDRPYGCCDHWQGPLKTTAKGLVHGHGPFKNVVQLERGLASKFMQIAKSLKAGKISRDNALTLGQELVDKKYTQLKEYGLNHVSRKTGVQLKELSPEQSQRLDEWRTKTLADFQQVIDDVQ